MPTIEGFSTRKPEKIIELMEKTGGKHWALGHLKKIKEEKNKKEKDKKEKDKKEKKD